jgi:hypothetical protein
MNKGEWQRVAPINIVEIKREKERKMPEVAKKDRSKRRAVNSDSGAKSKSPLSV